MAKNRTLEEKLATLNELGDDPRSPAATDALGKALTSKTSFLVARAAEIISENEIDGFTESLVDAFERFMVEPTKTDKGCKAKTAIAEALYRVDHDGPDVFLRGIRHVQPEPVYGGNVDTAGQLRGVSAIGLARMNYPDVMIELARLLADPEPSARSMAARAIGAVASEAAGVPLLRYKVLIGDDDHRVLGECFSGLLALDAEASLTFIADILRQQDSLVCEAALLALGESQLDAAFDVIEAWWPDCHESSLRRTALLAIGLLRKERAMDYLISLAATERAEVVRDAIEALAVHAYDARIRQRVEELARTREDVDLRPIVEEAFGSEPAAPGEPPGRRPD